MERSLNLTVDHCKNKTIKFALLELVANSIDANGGKEPVVTWSSETLIIEDGGDGVRDSDFQVGQTSGREGTIGTFGIGLLDSVAILRRLGASFSARAYWAKFTFPIRGTEEIWLKTEVVPGKNQTGTRWEIQSPILSAAVVDELKSWFLQFDRVRKQKDLVLRTAQLEVYRARIPGRGCVFINGRRVEGFAPFTFDYNFPQEDMIDYGREHKVSSDVWNQKLVPILRNVCETLYPKVIYDNLPASNVWGKDGHYGLSTAMHYKQHGLGAPPNSKAYKEAPVPPTPKKQHREPPHRPNTSQCQKKKKGPSGFQVLNPGPGKVIVDHDAAEAAGSFASAVSDAKDRRLVLVGTKLPDQPIAKGKKAPLLYHTSTRMETAVTFGSVVQKYADVDTVWAGKDLQLAPYFERVDRLVTVNELPPPPPPSSSTTDSATSPAEPAEHGPPQERACLGWMTANQLNSLCERERLDHSIQVQPVKERIEKWLAGMWCTVLLGGSIKKGCATSDSDVDIVVEVPKEKLQEAEDSVRKHARLVGHVGGPNGSTLLQYDTHFGVVDIVVSCPGRSTSADSLRAQLKWFDGVRAAYPKIEDVVILAKVWKERTGVKQLRGMAIEVLAARVAGGRPTGPLDKDDRCEVLFGVFKELAKGKQVIMPPFDRVGNDAGAMDDADM
ncbi:hypothetical protein DIPPA_02604 [Diplonema papillatum]|nr:hypothetical protein DIPPA_02604 [Diplonema papillatum]